MFAPLFLFYALWTQYLDIKLVWGWQHGAYIGLLTHWTFGLTTLFLLLCTLVDFGAPLKGAKTNLLYMAIAETLFVDIGFYVVELPRLDKSFSKHSWISAHKHFFNLIWILAIASEGATGEGPCGRELLLFGLLAPTALHLVYYMFARTIANPESGKLLLSFLGIPEPEKDKSIDTLWQERIEPSRRNNITIFPGTWIYPAFHSNFLTLAFALSHFVSLPISYGLLTLINHSNGARVFLKWFAIFATPFLYSDEYDDYIFSEFLATLLGVQNFRENPPVVFEHYQGFALWTRDVMYASFGTRDEILEFLWQGANDTAHLDFGAIFEKIVIIARICLSISQQAMDWMLARFITASIQLSRRISALLPSFEDIQDTYFSVKARVTNKEEAKRAQFRKL